MLQWGHRLSVMETLDKRKDLLAKYRLQWGHRLSVMETEIAMPRHNDTCVLQWGHRLSVMETAPCRSRIALSRSSFNGATAFR